MANKDPLLSFEEFMRRSKNFCGYFLGEPGNHVVGDSYRKHYAYAQCMASHPEEFGKLAEELQQIRDPRDALEDYAKLYKAYALMFPFAESNEELFK